MVRKIIHRNLTRTLALVHAKTLLFAMIMIYLIAPSALHAGELVATDKAAHFGVSATATAALIKLQQAISKKHDITVTNRLISSVLVLSTGCYKELTDLKKKDETALDQGDMTANLAGVVVGNLIQWEF